MSESLNSGEKFDVLSDVLDTLRFNGSIFFESKLAAPWGMSLSPQDTPRFHIMLSGACYAGNSEVRPTRVQEGEIVMLTGSSPHWLADEPGRDMVTSEAASNACELGRPLFNQGEITNRVMCGTIHIDQEIPHPIFSSLPDILHFKSLQSNELIWGTVRLIEAEIRLNNDHTGSIIDRLTEVLFLQLLDNYAENNTGQLGFLGVLKDRRINHALALIHAQPHYPWTLQQLGERIGMSRATLVRQFNDLIGQSPITYIANWRLIKACYLARYSDNSMETIAQKVGYSSVSALNKAFFRKYKFMPSAVRK